MQHFHSVCFTYFLVSVVVVVALISIVPLPRKTILDHGTILPEKLTIRWKTQVEIDVRR